MAFRWVVVLLSGCALVRTPITEGRDAGLDAPGLDAPPPDVPGLDAPLDTGIDAPGLDAPPPDVPGLDAPLDTGIDAPLDTGIDAPLDTGVDAPPCDPMESACDGIDEDCDGTVDDGVCSLGGPCTAITIDGIAYQSCPAADGFTAWSGACRAMGPGYELVVMSSAAQRDQLGDALSDRALNDPHWIGLNDFEANGDYVWLDRASTFAPTGLGSDPAKACVVFRSAGTFEDLPCSDDQRVLCALDPAASPCSGESEGTACDGRDQDCDGTADDGLACGSACTARMFWDRVYYVCTTNRAPGAASTACASMGGAELVSLNHATEHVVVAFWAGTDSLIGLTQSAGASSATNGWSWPDATSSWGVPPVVGTFPWSTGEPNDFPGGEDGDENCALLQGVGDRFNDRGCTAGSDFVCETGWTY